MNTSTLNLVNIKSQASILPPPVGKWQKELADQVNSLEQLCALLELDPNQAPWPLNAQPNFPLRLPRSLVARMPKHDWYAPMLLQYLPRQAETNLATGYVRDPVGDLNAHLQTGLLHKYHGRVLLLLTGHCAVHCRYCFRQHFPYQDSRLDSTALANALAYIRQDASIQEVIFSGGDPLVIKDSQLAKLMQSLAEIPHVQRVRIHSRLPLVLPSRVTAELLVALKSTRLQTVMVIHSNHATELDAATASALQLCHQAGVWLLNQTVLLKHVNDRLENLIQLSETLFSLSVLPYYLHKLDAVQGAAHFALSDLEIETLYQQLQASLPGYLVPKLVTEIAGAAHKIQWSTPIGTGHE